MKPRLLNLLTTLPLLLFLAGAALWARSAYVGDVWTVSMPGRRLVVRSDWGRLSFAALEDPGAGWGLGWNTTVGGYAGELPGRPTSVPREFAGLRYVSGIVATIPRGAATTVALGGRYWWVQLYHPYALVLLLVPVVSSLRGRLRSRRRAARGLCRSCGYNLRATPARCPECGATPG